MSRSSAKLLALVALLAAGCGGGGGSGSDDPCSLASPEMIGEAFGGNVSDGEPGQGRNCTFTIAGGSATSVNVYHYGSASAWDSTRSGFEENRSGTTDLPGLGTDAFHPNDVGPSELVVQAGDIIFSVSTGLFGGSGPQSDAGLLRLAGLIAADQSG